MAYDEDLKAQVLDAYLRHGNAAAVARELEINERRAQRIVRQLAREGVFAEHEPMPGFEIARMSTTRGADGEVRARTIREAPGRDEEPIPDDMALRGMSVLEDQDGRRTAVWRKFSREDLRRAEAIEAIREAFEGLPAAIPVADLGMARLGPPLPVDLPDCWTVYLLPDLHFGLLAHRKETGESFDLDIADREYRDALRQLTSFTPNTPASTVLFLGDFFHTNTQLPLTPRSSHLLDVDGRWRKVLLYGSRFACFTIEQVAANHWDTEVVTLPGNHDPDAARALDVALEMRYGDVFNTNERRLEGVTVKGTWGHHWFRRWGATLVGATHGHTLKPPAMATLLAEERPEDWGKSVHRHFLFGHVHHETSRRIGSVRVESFGAPCARSTFEAAAGYASRRTLTALVYHRKLGEIARYTVPLGLTALGGSVVE